MKTQVQDTSIDCYHDLQREGHLSHQQMLILDVIQEGRDYTLQELVRLTGLGINAVSGRCNELRKLELLSLADRRKCSISTRTVWPVRLPTKQKELFQ